MSSDALNRSFELAAPGMVNRVDIAKLRSRELGKPVAAEQPSFERWDGDLAVPRDLDPFSDSALPSATGVIVKSLFNPDWLIEIEAVAVAPAEPA
ncbi:hypothetical protein [Pseudonocardia spinosispora]|uniref:hypothetical protein n=1 Tax=Pseudonocardia spinosispora TaxID=103441 RepID=UPI00042646F2|nr:hypothetical protein [Pseudonocardia spinosispora]